MPLLLLASYLIIWWLFFAYRYPKYEGGWDDVLWVVFMGLTLAGGFPLAALADDGGSDTLAFGGGALVFAVAFATDYMAWRVRPGNGSYRPLVGPRRSGNGRQIEG